MAGIAGIVSVNELDMQSLLDRMAESMRFSRTARVEYWNDSRTGLCGVYPSSDQEKSQLVFTADKTACLLMFGECFGYEEKKRNLIRQGYAISEAPNDAEFILNLYQAHGRRAFNELSGSYSFAICDNERRSLLLVNDRLGSRPVFYGAVPSGKLFFATHVSSMLKAPDISRQIVEPAVLEFCTLQRVLGNKTYHQGIRLLPPASVLHYYDGKLEISPYWYPDYKPRAGSLDEYAEELASVMKRTLGHVTRNGDRVAMLLSGGLDARMAVAAVGDKLMCYCFGDYENAEVQTARRIAEAGHCEFRFLERGPDHYANIVETAVEIGSGMHAFNHAHSLGFIEEISKDFNVITHGFVPELLFRGYSLPKIPREYAGIRFGSKLDPDLTESNLPHRLYRRGYSLLDKGVEKLFAPKMREGLEEILMASARELIAEADGHARDIYDRFLWPDIYYHARYPSMLFELSLRSFMIERSLVFYNEVIDLHLELPVHLRSDNRLWLKAMERLNRDVAHTIDANTGRSPFFPVPLESAIKSAGQTLGRLPLLWRLCNLSRPSPDIGINPGHSPISWPKFDLMIRKNAKLRQLITNTLSDTEALPPEIFDLKRVQALVDDQLGNNGQHRVILFALLTFGLWHKRYAP